MFKYCSVFYNFKGRGITQEITTLYINGEKKGEWKDKYFIDFLNFMAENKWELVSIVFIYQTGFMAYFKQQVQ